MPNGIKYSTGTTPAGCLRKGNMLISNNTADTGTTFFTGITPPSSGYTIYLNKTSGGPSIYCPANDIQLIFVTNQIAGTNYTTATQCFEYFASQTDKLCTNKNYPGIVTSASLISDASFIPSYPTTATTWYDISGNINNGTLTNGPSFIATSSSFNFDGTDDTVSTPIALTDLPALSNFTLEVTTKIIEFPQPLSPPNQFGSTTRCGVLLGAAYYSGVALYWYGDSSGTSCAMYSYIRGNDAYRTTSGFSMSLNKWYTFTLVNNYSSNSLSLYVNGVLFSSVATATQEYNSGLTSNAGNIGLSKPQVDGGGEAVYSYWKGQVNNYKIYKKALSASEISQNFLLGNILTTGLSMDVDAGSLSSNNTSTTITDITSNAYVWNYEGTVSLSNNFGGTLRLNTGRIYRDSLSWYGNYTISFWVRMVDVMSGNFYTENFRGSGGCARIFSTMNANGTFSYSVWDNSSIGTFGTGAFSVTTTTNVQDGNWHQITCIWSNGSSNRTRGIYVYCDGVQEAYTDMIGNDGSYSSMHLGGASGCVGEIASNSYLGPILQYLNVALTDSQVKQNYNAHVSRFK